ncbi:hypothetical protein GXW82_21315 [Streptacidiphilus sp. 4-A2]|nr:hypothetical protein [Streptacidiphilus sp. 4-A2]
MSGAKPLAPTLLASGSAWSGVSLINPGSINGNQALWTRNTSTGQLTQYLNINADTTSTLTGQTIAGSTTYSGSAYPLITSAAVTGSGATNGPALWAVDSTGTLQLIPTSLDSSGNATVYAPQAKSAGGWGPGLTNLS